MTVDVRPWFGPKGWFHEPPDATSPPNRAEQLVFGFLVRGETAHILKPKRRRSGTSPTWKNWASKASW
jgi:hypothetical protein